MRGIFLLSLIANAVLGATVAQAEKSPLANSTTAQLVADCDAHPEAVAKAEGACPDEILFISAAQIINGTTCPSQQALDDQPGDIRKVIAWLKAHKELADTPHMAAVTAAYKALYPCH